MYQALYKYFALYRYLFLPGIGRIVLCNKQTSLDFVNRLITPAPQQLSLLTEAEETDDKLVAFLAKELAISLENANEKLNIFSNKLQSQARENGKVVMPGIGTLTHINDVFQLTATESTAMLFSPIVAERIIRKNSEHLVRVGEHHISSGAMQQRRSAFEEPPKDNWWVAAVIILILAVGGSLLFLLRHKLYWF